MKNLLLTSTLIAVTLSGFSALAEEDCPIPFIDENRSEKVLALVKSKKHCEAAGKVSELCALGSSWDRTLTSTAIEVCEKDYKNITPADQKILNTLNAKCTAKYAKEEGTMYISFEGFCRLDLANMMAKFYLPISVLEQGEDAP